MKAKYPRAQAEVLACVLVARFGVTEAAILESVNRRARLFDKPPLTAEDISAATEALISTGEIYRNDLGFLARWSVRSTHD